MISLAVTDLRVDVSAEYGGRLLQVFMGENELLVARDHPAVTDPVMGWGCFPMVPWAGRLRKGTFPRRGRYVELPQNRMAFDGRHALHGLGVLNAWNVAAQSASSMVMRLDLAEAGWPFGGWAEQRISLSPTSVQLEMSVHSEKDEFPVQIGWHPWFVAPESLDVAFTSMYVRDAEGVATAETTTPSAGPWDDCFTGALHPPRLRVNGVNIGLTSDCSHWVVFDELAHGVCVEPQSGPPDMLNLYPAAELDTVAPGRTVVRHFTMSFG
jgi:aldose 1-epimerase